MSICHEWIPRLDIVLVHTLGTYNRVQRSRQSRPGELTTEDFRRRLKRQSQRGTRTKASFLERVNLFRK